MHARLVPCLLMLVGVLARPLAGADALETADKAANEWLKLQIEAARVESDWRTERELLTSIASGVAEKVKLQEEKRDLAKAKTAQERVELQGIKDSTQRAHDELVVVGTRLNALAAKLAALRPRLPPHLSDALEMSYRTLARTDSPETERMQIAMNILNRCGQFNRLVTVADDVLTLEGEPAAKSYEVIYWGLSRGYAIDRGSRKAWLGAATAQGWRWEPLPEGYSATAKAIAIAQGAADPDFVKLPGTATKVSSNR